jgi:lysophospholipase L1-like esterase
VTRNADLSPTWDAPYAHRDGLGLLGPGSPMFEGLALRTWRAAWANRRTTPVNVLICGDSNGVGYYGSAQQDPWVRQLTTDLCTANGQRPDPGYVPRHSLTNYLHTWTTSGAVTEFATSGLGYAATSPAANGGYIEVTETCDRFWVRYTGGTLIGVFTVTIDGGAPITVAFQAGTITGGRTWDSGPLTRGAHTVRITSTDPTFACRLEGIYFFDGNGNTSGAQGLISAADSQTGTGVRVWNGAKFGTRAGHFAASSATTWWTDGLDKVNPHLVILAWITNEITAGTSAAQYKADMAAVVAQINTVMAAAGKPAPSYVVVVPHGTGASASTITPYRTAAYEVAATIGAATVDRSALAGYVGTNVADVWGITTPLDGSSRVHLSTQGHREMGQHLADYLLRSVGARPAGVSDTGTLPVHQLPVGTSSTTVAAGDDSRITGAAPLNAATNNQTGTTYTLVLSDAGKVVELNNASAITLTVPTNASVAFPTGTPIGVWQQGAGQVTVTAAGGVTLRAPAGAHTRAQYSTLSLRYRGGNEWVISGDAS